MLTGGTLPTAQHRPRPYVMVALQLLAVVSAILVSPCARADGPTPLQLQNQFAAGSGQSSTAVDSLARQAAASAMALAVGAVQANGGSASSVTAAATGAPIARSLAARAADSVNVIDFGAVPDLAYMYGPFAMAVGSNVLYTNAYRFGGSQVGQTIIIPGAGPNGAALVTKITAIQPIAKSNVTVSTAASTQIGDPTSSASIQNSPLITVETATDSTAAINSAIAAAAAKVTNSGSNLLFSSNLYFPAGEYLVSSINLTGINSIGFTLFGPGAHLHGYGAGNIVVDALGATFLRWNDIEIDGDLFDSPRIGLQIGRYGTTSQDSAGGHSIDHLATYGNFSLAAVLNENAETTTWYSPRISNLSPNAYAYIADGSNHFAVTSQFIKTTIPVDSGQSFDENLFLNPIFMTAGAGSTPLWISNAQRLRVVSGYVANTDSISATRAAVTLFESPGTAINQLDLDIHSESYITSVFKLSGSGGVSTFDLQGLRYRENGTFASSSIFAVDPASGIQNVTLENADIDVAQFVNAGAKLFDNAARYSGSGRLYVPAGTPGVPASASFSGMICTGLVCDAGGEVTGASTGASSISLSAIAQMAAAALPAAITVSSRSAAYSVGSADCNSIIRDTASTSDLYTVPTGLPIGCSITIIEIGTGTVRFGGASGETIEQTGQGTRNHAISGQFGRALLVIDSPSSFVLTGDVN